MRALERGLDEGLLLRVTGDTIAVAPPFISTPEEVKEMVESLRRTLRSLT
jgi:beta-alanine--pyruvate transaminase